MAQVERRKGQRRKGPIRGPMERRVRGLKVEKSTRSGNDRRSRDRRTGKDRRKASR